MEASATPELTDVSSVELSPQIQTAPPRVSISFDDGASKSYALLKRLPPTGKSSARPEIDVWYGQYYEDQIFRVLPASPFEKEPSRLNVKISFAF
ncbi:MAG: hypothetical protein QM813_09135 [Verrucomicrobiota bacterium]